MKPNSGNSKWECKHGCDQKWWIKHHQRGCPHLENMLNSAVNHPVNRSHTNILEMFTNQCDTILPPDEQYERDIEDSSGSVLSETEERKLRIRLAGLGLSSAAIEIVFLRAVKEHTYPEIAKILGYANRANVRRVYVKATKVIKQRFRNEHTSI